MPVSDSSLLETLHDAAAAVGDGQTADMRGFDRLVVHVTGTFAATVNFEASIDDQTWFPISLVEAQTQGQVTSAALIFSGGAPVAASLPMGMSAISAFRARIGPYTSGSVTVRTRKEYT